VIRRLYEIRSRREKTPNPAARTRFRKSIKNKGLLKNVRKIVAASPQAPPSAPTTFSQLFHKNRIMLYVEDHYTTTFCDVKKKETPGYTIIGGVRRNLIGAAQSKVGFPGVGKIFQKSKKKGPADSAGPFMHKPAYLLSIESSPDTEQTDHAHSEKEQ
jgi:hypothetical protein